MQNPRAGLLVTKQIACAIAAEPGTIMTKLFMMATATALASLATPLMAQTNTTQTAQPTSRDRIGAILGQLLGGQGGGNATIEADWTAGRTPLATQRTQFDTRVDSDVRSGGITQAVGSRLKTDYADLVALEARYGADRRFTTAEKTELSDRYGALTQILATGAANGGNVTTAAVADGRNAFNSRVDAQVGARRLTRTVGTTLKNDYTALIQVETGYLRDGTISVAERNDLDNRLDALDQRVGDTQYSATIQTPRMRLAAIGTALPSSGLSASAQAQLLVEHGDLARLEGAYSRVTPNAEEQAYLEQRLSNLETRARVRR